LGQTVDISRLPDELKSLGDSLNIMRSRLKNDFVRLTQLADDLAHELRTPINAIKIQNEITLQKTRTADEYEAIIASNTEELDKLAKIIQNILFIARAENKNINLKRETIIVSELVEDIYELLAFYADERNIRLVNK
ncbi:histidine kinase dimerization/phospho-acceptor domain-containing protein, partial [Morganella morganii]